MCVSTSPSAPVASTSYRDTSEDPIVSNYPLSDAQKAENKRRKAAKNKSKSLVNFGDENNTGAGVTIAGGTMKASTPTSNYGGMDMSNIA